MLSIDLARTTRAHSWTSRAWRHLLSVLLVGLALLPELSFAFIPIEYPKWGSFAYGVPYEFDSFGALAADRMPIVAKTQSPFAYPKYIAHPGQNCDNNDNVTGLTGTGTGTGLICSEAKGPQRARCGAKCNLSRPRCRSLPCQASSRAPSSADQCALRVHVPRALTTLHPASP